MSPSPLRHRPGRARLAGALLALSLLAVGCSGGEDPAAEDAPASSSASDAGGQAPAVSDGGSGEAVVTGSAEGEGQSSAAVAPEPIAATPAPEGFEPPAACSGEGAYLATVGGAAGPDLPERDGETLLLEAAGISGDDAQLTASVGEGPPVPIEDLSLGDTATIEHWTISVTSVCSETDQIEFDLID